MDTRHPVERWAKARRGAIAAALQAWMIEQRISLHNRTLIEWDELYQRFLGSPAR